MATKQRKASKTKERAKKSTKPVYGPPRRTAKDIKFDKYGRPHPLEVYRKNHWKIPASVYKVDEKETQVVYKKNLGPLGRPPTDPKAREEYLRSKRKLTETGQYAAVGHRPRAKKSKKPRYTKEYYEAMLGDEF